jgi:ferredoxin
MNVVYIGAGIALLLWILPHLYRRRKNWNKVICVVESNCTGCGRCVKRCSRRVLVLKTVKNEAGTHAATDRPHKYIACADRPDKCTACGDCLGKCRFNALKLIERV